jgi:hypothetical protein
VSSVNGRVVAIFPTRLQFVNRVCFVVLSGIALTFAQVAQAADGPLEFPRIPRTEPADAAKSFETRDGFRMQLIAAEPLVTSPVVLEYDEHGQGWVLEMRDYPFTDKSTDKPFAEKSGDMPMGRTTSNIQHS